MRGRAARLVPVAAAVRAADQARLAACLLRQRQFRAEAAEMLRRARTIAAPADAAEMALSAEWQRWCCARADGLTKAAAALEPEVARLRARLARSLGRENAALTLLDRERDARRAQAERRAEDGAVPPARRAPQ